jgi:hypothetical protein
MEKPNPSKDIESLLEIMRQLLDPALRAGLIDSGVDERRTL